MISFKAKITQERPIISPIKPNLFFRFTCFTQVMNVKSFFFSFEEQAQQTEKFQVHNLYKTHKSSKNMLANFSLYEEIMGRTRTTDTRRVNP